MLKHLRHEGQAVQTPLSIKRPGNFTRAPYFHAVARSECRIDSVHRVLEIQTDFDCCFWLNCSVVRVMQPSEAPLRRTLGAKTHSKFPWHPTHHSGSRTIDRVNSS
jgi:hypothetical protein